MENVKKNDVVVVTIRKRLHVAIYFGEAGRQHLVEKCSEPGKMVLVNTDDIRTLTSQPTISQPTISQPG